jgi:hypothetical protein
MTHFNKYAQRELNEYRQAIMANTAKLGSPTSASAARFPATMLCTPQNANTSVLQIAVNNDAQAPFLDLRFPAATSDSEIAKMLYGKLYSVITKRILADPEKYPASTRASFGFPHSNFTLIGGAKLRFNPGLEDEATLSNYRDLFVDANNLLTQVWQDFQALGETREKALGGVSFCTNDDLIKIHAKVFADGDGASQADLVALATKYTTAPTINPVGALRTLDTIDRLYPAADTTGLRAAATKWRADFMRA